MKNKRSTRLKKTTKILFLLSGFIACFTLGLLTGWLLTKNKQKPLELNIKGADVSGFTEMRDLKGRIDSKEIRIIDVRDFEQYQEGHIKNARSFPFQQLRDRLDEIPKNLQIIVYGNDLTDQMAMEAYNILKEKGYDARALLGGFEEWKAAKYPIEK